MGTDIKLSNNGNITVGWKTFIAGVLVMFSIAMGSQSLTEVVGLSPTSNKLDIVLENARIIEDMTKKIEELESLEMHPESARRHEQHEVHLQSLDIAVKAHQAAIESQKDNIDSLIDVQERSLQQTDKIVDRMFEMFDKQNGIGAEH